MDECKKTIIITGANGNVGSALAETLLERGDNTVLLFNQNRQRIDFLLGKYPKQTIALQCDIKDYDTLNLALQNALSSDNWRATSLVHTAAMRSVDHSPLKDSDSQVWNDVINTNVIGTYNVLKAAINCFQKPKDKVSPDYSSRKDTYHRIVLFSSNVSRIGLPYGSAYGASKAAVSNITRSLGVELSEDKILINTISPGPINIDDSHFSEEYRKFREEYYKNMLLQIPLRRFADLDDIVSLTLFLISEENKYITGEELYLTGGKL